MAGGETIPGAKTNLVRSMMAVLLGAAMLAIATPASAAQTETATRWSVDYVDETVGEPG